MKSSFALFSITAFALGDAVLAADSPTQTPAADKATVGEVTPHSGGLHGYIGCHANRPPQSAEYGAGISFYTAIWPLIDRPLADFQIGLAGTWIMPDNSDDKDTPLAPPGTYARRWKERGPTFSEVFQTIEGSPGY